MTQTIMIVESDILARMTLAEYLRECGYKVVEGVGAQDVWAVLNAGMRLDIVLTDMQPEADGGFSLAQRLREHHPGIDIVLVSGTARAADKAGELCDEGPLQKPYHPREVVRRIQLLRKGKRASKQS